MGRAVALREDFDGPALRRLAKASKDAGQSRRLLALAEIYDGGRRTEAARIGTVGLQVVRDWFSVSTPRGRDGLIDGKATGKPAKLNDRQRQALARLVESGPIPAIHGVVRWRRKDLAHWIFEEFRISVDETTVGRELRALGFRKISARPRHKGQNEFAVEDFKKNFPAGLGEIRARLPANTAIEIWWQDEAWVGQKTMLTRRWRDAAADPRRSGTNARSRPISSVPSVPRAVSVRALSCPAATLRPCNGILMKSRPGDTRRSRCTHHRPGRMHTTGRLEIPSNITLMFLPPRAPELNPVENIWQFMRDNWLSNRIFKTYDDIVALCCEAWNRLIDQPWKIMSIGTPKMGPWVLINARWYKGALGP